MSKEVVDKPGSESIKCDVCGKLSVYTCSVCFGDYCKDHRVHGEGHQ